MRELKRWRTRRSIEDAATSLVDEKGFDAVTVDDICAAAGISRRTFFNYMDSKDGAVLGSPPLHMDEDSRQTFLTTPSDNLVALIIELLSETGVSADDGHGEDPEFLRRLQERRRRIFAAEPALAMLSCTRFREQLLQLHGLIVEHLETIPGDRKLPDLPVELEARILNGLIRETVWLHVAHPDISFTPESDRGDLLRGTASIITDLAKELTWQNARKNIRPSTRRR